MNILSEIIDLNNQAIFSLMEGDQRRALKTIKVAFKKHKQLMVHNEPQQGEDYSVTNDENMGWNNMFRGVPISQEGQKNYVVCSDKIDALCTFYDCAYAICDDDIELSPINEAQNTIYVALLYNMGLIHHSDGLSSCNSSKIATALKCYEKAIWKLKCDGSAISLQDRITFLLPLLNNMIYIHSSLFNEKKVRSCVELMQTVFEHHDEDELKLSEEQYRFFHLNLIMFTAAKQVVSPAA